MPRPVIRGCRRQRSRGLRGLPGHHSTVDETPPVPASGEVPASGAASRSPSTRTSTTGRASSPRRMPSPSRPTASMWRCSPWARAPGRTISSVLSSTIKQGQTVTVDYRDQSHPGHRRQRGPSPTLRSTTIPPWTEPRRPGDEVKHGPDRSRWTDGAAVADRPALRIGMSPATTPWPSRTSRSPTIPPWTKPRRSRRAARCRHRAPASRSPSTRTSTTGRTNCPRRQPSPSRPTASTYPCSR